MVVQHNLTAMNSNRMLGLTTKTQAKSTERLSSGYKINRAADDAAGLSISEKMRKQIRGLTQASANAQDGISAVQTAEGALNEVQDMLQRMNELSVKASNGTMSENDRSYIQNEIDQLVTEIDRVAETTKFNETYLLKGDGAGKVGGAETKASLAGGTDNVSIAANTAIDAGDYSLGTVRISTLKNATTTKFGAQSTVDNNNTKLQDLLNSSDTGKLTFTVNAIKTATDANTSLATASWTITGGSKTINVSAAELKNTYGIDLKVGTAPLVATDKFELEKELAISATQQAKLNENGIVSTATTTVTAEGLKDINVGSDLLATVSVDRDGVATVGAYDPTATARALNLSLHVGADSTADNKIGLDISSMSAKGLGLRTTTGDALKVDGKDSTNADAAIDTIAAAIQKVSTQRSALGAIQNRLEHTINNLDNVVENTTSAESAIRDTDMATEMVKYSNNNILAQAGQSMLAQANQSNQGVLSLLG